MPSLASPASTTSDNLPVVLIVYHSMTDGTRQIAQACASAARAEASVNVIVKLAQETDARDILAAAAYVFATPEYLGGMSGMMKDMFDRTFYDALDKIEGRPYATMICAGSDGQGAVRQIERIATGWRLKAVAPPAIVHVSAQTPKAILATKHLRDAQLKPCAELGSLMAAGLALGLF